MRITVRFTHDGIDPEGYMESEHASDYGDSLKAAICAVYPTADVTVTEGIEDQVIVHADEYTIIERVGSEVQNIIADHWQPWVDKVAARIR